jgi:fibronectin type 3 domain-containing protein
VISAKQVKKTKTAVAKWDTVKGATSYTIYLSTKQKSGYKKVGTTKKTSFTLKKYGKSALKKNKTYYVYVVANKKVGKTTYTSDATYCYQFKLSK